MSKISKNIKQLRTERNMSQTELAEKLFLTRQAVSSWENGRTQPDIQMLGKLRVIFDVSIEELLYGKKRNTTLELQKPSCKGTLVTVFSVLGSLLVAVGLILIFVAVLDEVPEFILEALGFLPFVAGTAAGGYVYAKKRDKKAWCEGGGVAWALGTVVTFILVNSMYELTMDGSILYITMCAMLVPIMFLLKSVTVLPFVYVTGVMGAIFCRENLRWDSPAWQEALFYILSFVVAGAVFAAGMIFRDVLRKTDRESHRVGVAEWLTAIAIPLFLIFNLIDLGNGVAILLTLSFAGLVYFIISQKESENTSPLALGFVVLCGMVSFFGISSYDIEFYYYNLEYSYVIILSLMGVAAMVGALIYIKGKFQSKLALALGGVYLLSHIGFTAKTVYELWCDKMVDADGANAVIYWSDIYWDNIHSVVMPLLALVFFAILIGDGASRKKLIPMNIGFVGFVLQVMFWIGASGLGMFTNGIVLLVCGVALLRVNLKISKMKEETVTVVVESYDYDDE